MAKLKNYQVTKNSSSNVDIKSAPGGNFTGWQILGNNKDIKIAVTEDAANLANSFKAGSASQTLIGGTGNDTFTGNGKSSLVGGNGNDTFVVSKAGGDCWQ